MIVFKQGRQGGEAARDAAGAGRAKMTRQMSEIPNSPEELLTYSDFAVYYSVNDKFLLYKKAGEPFGEERLLDFRRPTRLFVSTADKIRVVRDRQMALNTSLKKAIRIDVPAARETLKNLVHVTLSEPRTEVFEGLKGTIDVIVDEFFENPEVVEQLTFVSLHDYSTHIHLINVMMLAVSFGYKTHMDRNSIKTLGLAGLMHDVGKTEIPDYILQAPRKLTEDEFAIVRQHPAVSYKMLRGFPKEVRLAALEHHERLDGTGYPENKTANGIGLLSKALAVIDVYEALTTWRPYKEPFAPLKALEILKKDTESGKFDTDVFRHFALSIVGAKKDNPPLPVTG